MSSEPTPINPRNGNNANIGEGLIWTGKTTGCLVTSKPVNTCSNTDGFPLKDTSWSRERRHQMTRRSKTTGKRETWRKPKTSHPVDKKSPGNSMGYAQSAKTHSSMMRSCKCITRNQKPKGERTTTATSSWYTIFAINKSTQRRRWKMSYRGREVRDLLERLEGRLSRAVLRWLSASGLHTWALRFLRELNSYAAIAAARIHACAPMDFGAFFVSLSRLAPPDYEDENRAASSYYKAACEVAVDIGLDLLIMAGAASGGVPAITRDDLALALSSPYCDVDTFLQHAVRRRRSLLEDAAVQWLLDDQETSIRVSIVPCAERARRYALLSALAALHGATEGARRTIARSAEHLLAHAYHKDMLFYHVLDALQRYAQAAAKETVQATCWPWLAQLAPAVAAILGYTDGDETRNFPVDLADTLALVAPEKLAAYYLWQCERGEHRQALSTLHAFLERADLREPLAHALAMSAIDQRSLHIIARRAAQGDVGAQDVQAGQQTSLGTAAFALTTPSDDQPMPDRGGAAAFDPALYPPAAVDASLENLPGPITAWIDYWAAHGQKREAYRLLAEADARGVDLACYDRLFTLALALYGKAKAYPWLVKAHIEGNGWSWYLSRQGEAEQRWHLIKQHYPARWQAFLQDTLLQMPLWLVQPHGVPAPHRVLSLHGAGRSRAAPRGGDGETVAGAGLDAAALHAGLGRCLMTDARISHQQGLSWLLSRLTWPVIRVRERASVELGALLRHPQLGGLTRSALLQWCKSQHYSGENPTIILVNKGC